MRKLILTGLIFLMFTGTASAREFLMGPETSGFKTRIDEDTEFSLRIRLQPRIDIGETGVKAEDQASYASITDMYFRRVRIELGGKLTNKLKFGAEIEADKTSKHDHFASASAYHLYGDYKLTDNTGLLFGKKKLPYTRVSLTSSSKQLLIERPAVTEDAKKLFGDQAGHGFYGPQLMLHGNMSDKMFKYYLSVTDGWQAGQTTKWTSKTVEEAGLAYIGRIELSPPGWVEGKQSDAHLGMGRHVTFGVNYAVQSGIEYGPTVTTESTFDLDTRVITTSTIKTPNNNGEDRKFLGADISFHLAGLALQGEYVMIEIEPSNSRAVKPTGYYVQAGYFLNEIALEPAVRYETYDKDSEKTDDDQTTITAGINWYLKGHSLKLSANYVNTTFGDNNSAKLADDDNLSSLQVQAQLYF